jgi:hypothetical protein
MNIMLIIKVIGLVCWFMHKNEHAKVCDAYYPPEGDEAEGRTAEKWMCRKCSKSWEVPS